LDRAITPPGLPASFRYDGYYPGVVFMREMIAVDPGKVYRLRAYVRRDADHPHTQSMGLATYDIDGNLIAAYNHALFLVQGDPRTTLTQPLKPGDTVMHVADASAWNDETGTANDSPWRRYLVIHEYRNSYGYNYGPGYSRLVWRDAWAPSGVDKTANVITLRTPLPSWMGNPDAADGTWPVGTRVANGISGATYKYAFFANYSPANGNIWNKTIAWFGGTDLSGANRRNNFPPGTAYARILWLPNYSNRAGGWAGHPDSGTGFSVWFSGASMMEEPYARLVRATGGHVDLIIPRINAAGSGWNFVTNPSTVDKEVE